MLEDERAARARHAQRLRSSEPGTQDLEILRVRRNSERPHGSEGARDHDSARRQKRGAAD
jgi:hypothetical protein